MSNEELANLVKHATLNENKKVTSKQDKFDVIAGGDAGKQLRLVTTAEDKHYEQLKENIEKGSLRKNDI